MIVYHGSNSRFHNFKISNSLCKNESTKTNEGIGIYFSTDRAVAESYGKYLYTVEIDDEYLVDFRKKENCKRYVSSIVKEIYQKTKIRINEYIDTNKLADSLYLGGIGINGTCREIYLLLDSNEKFYSLSNPKVNTIYRILKTYDRHHLQAYLFNYHIKNIGVIKKIDDNLVKIINVETYKENIDEMER